MRIRNPKKHTFLCRVEQNPNHCLLSIFALSTDSINVDVTLSTDSVNVDVI
jgi:hypothetical protein